MLVLAGLTTDDDVASSHAETAKDPSVADYNRDNRGMDEE
jgi:hypothetical protein